jgi:prepilin-type N-terminal cleavage/methylation domain-containing protein
VNLATAKAHRQSVKGFTLIELTIVITIIALGAGIIAPLTFKELEKSKARVEFLSLRNTIKTLTTKAFSRGAGYRVSLVAQKMTIESVKGQQVYEYDYLTFPGVSFFINHNGFPSIALLTVKVDEQNRQITMEDMLGVKQEDIYAK